MFKSERREAKRRNQRKMIVRGRSVLQLAHAQSKRDADLLAAGKRPIRGPKVVE
jgi:hypothetical protein